MRENFTDKVVDKLGQRFGRAKEKFGQLNKGVKPFRQEAESNDELIYIYDNMTDEDMQYLLDNYEEYDINQRLFEVAQLKQRRITKND